MLENNKSEKRLLNIIIVGGGNVGATITEQLSREGHHITVIDRDPEIVKHISATYDVLGIVGNGSSYKVQIEAGIETADLLIAVTASDELNLLCCTMAKKVGNCASIARVRTPDYSDELGYIRQKLGLSMIINPELEAAREIARLLRLPGALSINSFARSHAELVKFRMPEGSPLVGRSIMQLSDLLSNVLVCAVEREGELHIPNGAFVFAEGAVRTVSTPASTVFGTPFAFVAVIAAPSAVTAFATASAFFFFALCRFDGDAPSVHFEPVHAVHHALGFTLFHFEEREVFAQVDLADAHLARHTFVDQFDQLVRI